jgi:prohibitin 2
MPWIVLTVILGLVGGVAWILAVSTKDPAARNFRVGAFVAAGLCATVWVILSIALSIHTVGQREVGIVKNFSGTLGHQTKSPGVVLTWPWQHIITESVALQKEVFVFDDTNSAVSKDQQPITATVVVNYQILPQDVLKLYDTVGPTWKATLLDGRVPQDFKETTAKFTSPQITLKRPALRQLTHQRLRRELCPKGNSEETYCIRVVDVFVNNVGYSAAYTDAIEQKQVQRQNALTAQAKVQQVKAEADQRAAEAEGEARAIRAKAKADADAIFLKGKALRNNPEVLRLEAIDKLSPQTSVVFCNSGDCPSFLPQALSGK